MTSFEENYSDAVEVDGMQFEMVMRERVLQIPPKLLGSKTQVEFGIQITNNTANPQEISHASLKSDSFSCGFSLFRDNGIKPYTNQCDGA